MKARKLWIKVLFPISMALLLVGCWTLVSSALISSPTAMSTPLLSGAEAWTGSLLVARQDLTGTAYLPVVARNSAGLVPDEITKDEAIRMLMTEILRPASSSQRVSASMLSQPLRHTDVVSSESGTEYTITDDTWFVFVDDDPCAMFEHPVRYVLINARTGSYSIIDEAWPPMINGVYIWDAGFTFLSIYPIVDVPRPVTGTTTTAPQGDYGDAPEDGHDAYPGIPGAFPTLYNTTNGKLGRPGGHTLAVGQEMLGTNASAENDASDPLDPDGVPNLVDADSDERKFLAIEHGMTRLIFDVTVDEGAPDVARYVNVLVDFDRDGAWGDDEDGVEWPVVNWKVEVPPGTTRTIVTPVFLWAGRMEAPDRDGGPVWMRFSLTGSPVEEALFSEIGGWDGSGQFASGEIEDSLVFLRDCPPSGSPPDGNGQPPMPPGSDQGPCGYPVQHYALIVDGGEHPGRSGTTEAAAGMYELFEGQGFDTTYLGPSKGGSVDDLNTKANIQSAISGIANQVRCGDRVRIFIIGHGSREGKTILLQQQGKKRERLTPWELDSWLDTMPECDGDDCDQEDTCCSVSVIIESCYSGNFKEPLVRKGRTVAVSSNQDQPSGYGSDGTGGLYSDGFIEGSWDPAADENGDGAVDTSEAHASAAAHVENRRGGAQTPSVDDQECECICPCHPSVDVEKLVWDEETEEWVGSTDARLGESVWFACEIENNGVCRDVDQMLVMDYLPYCLEYGNDAFLYRNGDQIGPREPDSIREGEHALEVTWELEELESLSPGEELTLVFGAKTLSPGEKVNSVYGSAHCTYDPSVVVDDVGSASVNVVSPLYYDDFSDQSSGWPVVQQPCYVTDYEGGNYRIRINRESLGVWATPGFDCANCTIEVEAWRSTGANSRYGIVFGFDADLEEGYLFRVQPGRQEYALQRLEDGTWVDLIPYTGSSYINSLYSHNDLKVTREGSQIRLYINDRYLASYMDSTYTGSRRVGVYAGSASTVPVWLRYDDFTVWGVGAGVVGWGAGDSSPAKATAALQDSGGREHLGCDGPPGAWLSTEADDDQ